MTQRILPGWVLGLAIAAAVAAPVAAQVDAPVTWPSSTAGVGLAPVTAGCASLALACADPLKTLRLHDMPGLPPGVVELRLAPMDLLGAHALGPARTQGLDLSLLGRANFGEHLGVYGRLGTLLGRTQPPHLGGRSGGAAAGLSWGVGLQWMFSEHGSAMLGWDSYDLRLGGEGAPVRATSLGLKWRY